MLTETRFTAWLRCYGEAWEKRKPELATALFTADATYREAPFDQPMAGREAIGRYWRTRVEASQDNVVFTFDILSTTGGAGLARWRSQFDWLPSGRRIELDGIFRCQFRFRGAEDGLCCALDEWWHRREIGSAGGAG